MESWINATGMVLGTLGAAALGLSLEGSRRWRAASLALVDRLHAHAEPAAPRCYDARELEGLPAPVQRYFRMVLKDGQPIVTGAMLTQTGMMNLSIAGEQWKPFTATQHVTTRRPGFVWDARIAMAPGVPVRVHDAYVDGAGLLHAAVLGLVDVAEMHGGGEIARGELMRYLAEAAWYPTALLPSQGVHWTAVDDRSAQATLVDGETSLTVLFRFDDAGLMQSGRAEARAREANGVTAMLPWEWRWSDHREHVGMMLPFGGEVAWMLPEGRQPYWRGTVTAISLDFAGAEPPQAASAWRVSPQACASLAPRER